MAEYTRITVALGKDEFDALRNRADGDYRHPREQARFMLRQALGLPVAPPVPAQVGGYKSCTPTLNGGPNAVPTK